MDKRQTFETFEELHAILTTLHHENADIRLLVDADGITRLEGKLSKLEKSPRVAESKAVLDNNITLSLRQVIAVNGIFKSDYSEC